MKNSAGETSGSAEDDSGSKPASFSVSDLIDLERSQIGHDIHDLLLPLIFAASANLQSLPDQLSDPKAGKRIKEALDWLQQALATGRNLLTEIYPAELDQLTWLAAAKDTARRLCGDSVEVIWIVDPASPICDPKWSRDLAATAYRVLVEALRNATRHGQAAKITVYCQVDQLVIVDDGIGFRPQDVPAGHFGIRAMKGRARLVGKQLTVDSKPGGPTTVRLTL